ncbi:MAG: hypothetical protein LUC43_04750, partial [Burkholderiales bacterium]|nr:hypothetical protein [Burkholderiales bacterium]
KGAAKYLIADAKFSKQDEVVALELITLLFKYRILISPARKSDVISGLSIYCGKETNRFAPLPLFNVQNPITHVAKPSSLSIIPIMPSSKETLLPAGFLDT